MACLEFRVNGVLFNGVAALTFFVGSVSRVDLVAELGLCVLFGV